MLRRESRGKSRKKRQEPEEPEEPVFEGGDIIEGILEQTVQDLRSKPSYFVPDDFGDFDEAFADADEDDLDMDVLDVLDDVDEVNIQLRL